MKKYIEHELLKFVCSDCDGKFMLSANVFDQFIDNKGVLTCPYCKSEHVEPICWTGGCRSDWLEEIGCLSLGKDIIET